MARPEGSAFLEKDSSQAKAAGVEQATDLPWRKNKDVKRHNQGIPCKKRLFYKINTAFMYSTVSCTYLGHCSSCCGCGEVFREDVPVHVLLFSTRSRHREPVHNV